MIVFPGAPLAHFSLEDGMEEFKRKLDELGTIIGDGIAYFAAWFGLATDNDETAHALKRYDGFFVAAGNALLWMALIQLNKVFDSDKRTVSMRNLLTQLKEDRALVPELTDDNLLVIEEKLDGSEEVWERLKRFRDQRLAHHDSTVTGDTAVLIGEINKLIDDIKEMYNAICRGHNRECTAFESIARDAERHTGQVVQLVVDEKDRVARPYQDPCTI